MGEGERHLAAGILFGLRSTKRFDVTAGKPKIRPTSCAPETVRTSQRPSMVHVCSVPGSRRGFKTEESELLRASDSCTLQHDVGFWGAWTIVMGSAAGTKPQKSPVLWSDDW